MAAFSAKRLFVVWAMVSAAATAPASAQHAPSVETDPREAIALSHPEKEHLLSGMRTYLESIQGIVAAIADNDLSRVPEIAKRSGAKLMGGASPLTGLKLPAGFVMMSLDTHDKFDKLAESARRGSSRSEVLEELSQLLGNCVSCHAAYRLGP